MYAAQACRVLLSPYSCTYRYKPLFSSFLCHRCNPIEPNNGTPKPASVGNPAEPVHARSRTQGVRGQHEITAPTRAISVPIVLQPNRLSQPHIKAQADAPAPPYPSHAATSSPRLPHRSNLAKLREAAAETPSSFPTTRATRGGTAAPGRSPGATELTHGARSSSCSSSTTPTTTRLPTSDTNCDELGEN